jgi:hypothetical protein
VHLPPPYISLHTLYFCHPLPIFCLFVICLCTLSLRCCPFVPPSLTFCTLPSLSDFGPFVAVPLLSVPLFFVPLFSVPLVSVPLFSVPLFSVRLYYVPLSLRRSTESVLTPVTLLYTCLSVPGFCMSSFLVFMYLSIYFSPFMIHPPVCISVSSSPFCSRHFVPCLSLLSCHLYSSFRPQTSVINSHTSCCHSPVFPPPLIFMFHPYSSLRPFPLPPFLSSVLVRSSSNLCSHTSCCHSPVFPRPLIFMFHPFSSLRPLPRSPFLSSVLVLLISSSNLSNHNSCSHPFVLIPVLIPINSFLLHPLPSPLQILNHSTCHLVFLYLHVY